MSIVIADETPRARIPHQCSQCYRMIRVGEQYHRQRSIYDGEPQVIKTCAQCERLVMDLWNLDYRGWADDWLLPFLPDFDEWYEVGALGLTWGRRHFLWSRKWVWRGRLMDYPEVTK